MSYTSVHLFTTPHHSSLTLVDVIPSNVPQRNRTKLRHQLFELLGASLLLGTSTLLGAPGLTTSNKKLLGAPGLTTNTSNKKLLGAPGLPTRSKDATRGKGHRY